MNSSKLILPAALTVFLAGGALATQAVAAPHDDHGGRHEAMNHGGNGGMEMGDCPMMRGGYQHGGKHMNMTPEQREKMRVIMSESDAKLTPLRDQLFIKHQELKALQNATNPDVKAVGQKANEINTLREQLRKERAALGDRIDKELGLDPGTHDFGRGHMGGHGGPKGK